MTSQPTPGEVLNGESVPHIWGPSRVGHGENQCTVCSITNREAWALGEMNHCERRATELASRPQPSGGQDGGGDGASDAGREALWKVVHEVWQLLDDSCETPTGREIDEERWQAVSAAMDALEALVPESEGPFWGGYPVNYLWPKGAAK